MSRPVEKNAIKTAAVVGSNVIGNGSLATAHFDRLGFDGARIGAQYTVADPAPTTVTATLIVQHDDDPAFGSPTTFATIAAALTDTKEGLAVDEPLDLRGAKRYARVSTTLVFSGGSSPAQKVGLAATLCGAQDVPK
jgi:hypothetical protein